MFFFNKETFNVFTQAGVRVGFYDTHKRVPENSARVQEEM